MRVVLLGLIVWSCLAILFALFFGRLARPLSKPERVPERPERMQFRRDDWDARQRDDGDD